MEHRWSARKQVPGSVVVECPRVGLVRAVLRDVSLGGMFIETNSAVLPLNAPVSVVFDLTAKNHRGGYCLQGMVVRHKSNGAGIMFLDPEAEALRSMRESLYGQTQAGNARRSEMFSSEHTAVAARIKASAK